MTFQPRAGIYASLARCTLALVSLISFSVLPVAALAIESPYTAIDAEADERATDEAFAAYPAKARRAGLIVAGYPESLLEVQRLQQYSADRFAALVAEYPRDKQAQIWDLVRYPGLAADLGRGGKKTTNELDDIADRYPSADHFAIIEEGRERPDLWRKIYALDLESQQSLSTILAGEPAEVQAAFDEVTSRPELMTLLAENIQWTTRQGGDFLENPAAVDARFAGIAEQVAARQRAAETEWADEVADPEAAEELEVAAREFADEYGLDYESELAAADARQPTSNTTIIIEQRVRPYPYWFGYPTWYDTAFWYPLSLSSHIGFGYRHGYGFGRGLGWRYASFGLPSPFFLGWYHDVYRPRFARNRGHRRSIRYYDQHRPHRSAQYRRHGDRRDRGFVRRDGRRDGHVNALRDRARVERRDSRRNVRFDARRDRRSHSGALADRALRAERREARAERLNDRRVNRRDVRANGNGNRNGDRVDRRDRRDRENRRDRVDRRNPDSRRERVDRRNRDNRRERVDRRERRNDRGLRQQARDQVRPDRERRSKQERREQRQLRRDDRKRNPAIRPGGRPAERVAARKNDGVRNNARLRQARADVPRVSKRERRAERRIARNDRQSSRRIARAQKQTSRREVRASSGGGQRRMKAASKPQRAQRMSKSNRGGGGSKNRGGRGGGNRGNRGNRRN